MSRLGDPSLGGEIHFLGMNNEFYDLLPVKVLVWATEHSSTEMPHVAAVLRCPTWSQRGICLCRAHRKCACRLQTGARASDTGQDSHLPMRDRGLFLCAQLR